MACHKHLRLGVFLADLLCEICECLLFDARPREPEITDFDIVLVVTEDVLRL